MSYPIDKKLVVAVSSTALFDFSKEHDLYREKGVDEFRRYQKDNRENIPKPSTAFPFIKRLLDLNFYHEEHPFEVVILSRNHADAGLRVMDAIKHYKLDITRAFFLAGQLPYRYMESLDSVLYLSTNKSEVQHAVNQGYPAGYVLPCVTTSVDENEQLRIAFDFDGVIVDDEAERVYKDTKNLDLFHQREERFREMPLKEGPLMPLLLKISEFQKLERQKAQANDKYTQMLRISIVTARNAPSHERLITTLENAGIDTDELFLLGGIEKKRVLDVLKPHIFFDDQLGHLEPAAESTPSVHIPFGIANIEDRGIK